MKHITIMVLQRDVIKVKRVLDSLHILSLLSYRHFSAYLSMVSSVMSSD